MLLVMDKTQKPRCENACLRVGFKGAAFSLKLKQLFGRDLRLKPLTKFHLSEAISLHCAYEVPKMQ